MRLSVAILVAAPWLFGGVCALRADPAANQALFLKIDGESIRVLGDGTFTVVSDGTGSRAKGTYAGRLTDAERADLVQLQAALKQLPNPGAADVPTPGASRTLLEFPGANGQARTLDVSTKFIIRPEMKPLLKFMKILDRVAPPKKGEMTFKLQTPNGPAKLWIERDGTVKVELGEGANGVAFLSSLTQAEREKILAARSRFVDLPRPTNEESTVAANAPFMHLFFRDNSEAAREVLGNQDYMKKHREALAPLMAAFEAIVQRLTTTVPPVSAGFIKKVPGPN